MKKTIAVIALLTVPALASAQAGLSKIQFLALQQELRHQGCGVTGRRRPLRPPDASWYRYLRQEV